MPSRSQRRCRAYNADGETRCARPKYFPTIWDRLRMPLCAQHADRIWACPYLRKGQRCLCPELHLPPKVVSTWRRPPWPKPLPLIEFQATCPSCRKEVVYRLCEAAPLGLSKTADQIANTFGCTGCGNTLEKLNNLDVPLVGFDADGVAVIDTMRLPSDWTPMQSANAIRGLQDHYGTIRTVSSVGDDEPITTPPPIHDPAIATAVRIQRAAGNRSVVSRPVRPPRPTRPPVKR